MPDVWSTCVKPIQQSFLLLKNSLLGLESLLCPVLSSYWSHSNVSSNICVSPPQLILTEKVTNKIGSQYKISSHLVGNTFWKTLIFLALWASSERWSRHYKSNEFKNSTLRLNNVFVKINLSEAVYSSFPIKCLLINWIVFELFQFYTLNFPQKGLIS
jgi:hypothetical protein